MIGKLVSKAHIKTSNQSGLCFRPIRGEHLTNEAEDSDKCLNRDWQPSDQLGRASDQSNLRIWLIMDSCLTNQGEILTNKSWAADQSGFLLCHMDGCVCVYVSLTWGRGKPVEAMWCSEQCPAGKSWVMPSCGCYFDMEHLPKHRYGPSSPLAIVCLNGSSLVRQCHGAKTVQEYFEEHDNRGVVLLTTICLF